MAGGREYRSPTFNFKDFINIAIHIEQSINKDIHKIIKGKNILHVVLFKHKISTIKLSIYYRFSAKITLQSGAYLYWSYPI